MKFNSNIKAIHFEEDEIPGTRRMPDLAVASLDRRPQASNTWTRAEWEAWAKWQATPGENSDAFRRRITEELKAAGQVGELVFVYSRGAFWQRNVAHRLLPD